MKKSFSLLPLFAAATIMFGCSSSSNSPASPPPPPPPPPPPADQSTQGLWTGQAVSPDIPDTLTSFEFDDSDGFEVGTAPFTADFQGGVSQMAADPALANDGDNSWSVPDTDGTVTFATPPGTLSLFARVVTLGDVATITVRDTAGAAIGVLILTDAFQELSVTRDPGAGDTLIGSVDIEVTTGEVVVDSFGYTYPSTASTDDVGCLFSPGDDFVCLVTDAVTDELLASANGSVMTNVDQVTGTGFLYAAEGQVFADGSTVAAITISAGTVSEGVSLDLTVDGTGIPIAVSTAYDDTYDRGSDLATVEASYTTFDILGDASSFDVDATGAISGTSAAGCMLMGQIAVLDMAFNVYDVTLNVMDGGGGTCGVPDGDYAGLGITQDEAATDDAFIFVTAMDGVFGLPGVAVK